jgi:acyl-CoA thioesterase I
LIMRRFLYPTLRNRCLHGLILILLAAASQAREHTILVLGDSISAAYGMSLEEGWVAMLARRLEQSHPGHRVVNASISGETTGGALRRLPGLLEEHSPTLVIIELGGNDGLRGYPVNRFRDNLRQLAALSRAAGAEVIIMPMEIPPNYGARYTASFRESYPLVAEETGSALSPFVLQDVATNPALMQEDGIHPSAEAQSELLATILPSILTLLEEG